MAPDRSAGLFSFAWVERSDVVSPGRLRLPGLDPLRRYRVRPVMLDHAPATLQAPPWWGVDTPQAHLNAITGATSTAIGVGVDVAIELSGAALGQVGLAAAQLDPDHALLYLVEAV